MKIIILNSLNYLKINVLKLEFYKVMRNVIVFLLKLSNPSCFYLNLILINSKN
jgi:hypothetical protein